MNDLEDEIVGGYCCLRKDYVTVFYMYCDLSISTKKSIRSLTVF